MTDGQPGGHDQAADDDDGPPQSVHEESVPMCRPERDLSTRSTQRSRWSGSATHRATIRHPDS
jgi:hypothetical protein